MTTCRNCEKETSNEEFCCDYCRDEFAIKEKERIIRKRPETHKILIKKPEEPEEIQEPEPKKQYPPLPTFKGSYKEVLEDKPQRNNKNFLLTFLSIGFIVFAFIILAIWFINVYSDKESNINVNVPENPVTVNIPENPINVNVPENPVTVNIELGDSLEVKLREIIREELNNASSS